MISIKVNGKKRRVPKATRLSALKTKALIDADVALVNGFSVSGDPVLSGGDEVFLFRRGERPSDGEMEALMASRHTPGVHASLRAATIGIAGLGGLGSTVSLALARIGVGRLVIADFDVVEPTNLNRQQYTVDQLGLKKTDAMAANIAAANPFVHVESTYIEITDKNALDIFAGVDVMIEAFDAPAAKADLARVFRSKRPGTPYIGASGVAGLGNGESIRIHKLGKNFYVVGDMESAAAPRLGLMAPRVWLAACAQANLAAQLITEGLK